MNYPSVLCIFSFSFIYVRSTDLFTCYKASYLGRVIHGAVILLADILRDLCYYEMKVLHCIRNRIKRTYSSNVLILKRGPKVKCSSGRPGRLLNALFTFNLGPVSTGVFHSY